MKLHRQLMPLLQDNNVDDHGLIAIIKDVSDSCEICFEYKKPKPRPIVGFPLENISMKM